MILNSASNLEDRYIQQLIDLRELARQNRSWSNADMIRVILEERNAFVFDTPLGPVVYHMPAKFFRKKPEEISKREYVESYIQKGLRADKQFNAWLTSMRASSRY